MDHKDSEKLKSKSEVPKDQILYNNKNKSI
jgi:hypothetical protein